ncbi:MAG: signal peptidase I [Candidatus Saccharibacteria bacterium]
MNDNPNQGSNSDSAKSILSTLGLLLLAPLLALFLTAFVFQSYQVEGPSMQTSLQNKDRLIVLKVPRTWARITHHDYIPNRGDVIIFNHPDISGLGAGEKQLIKRVIALPGERVVVKNGELTVYNKEHPNGFSPDHTMPYGSVIKGTSGDVDLTVPDGEIFVCGDNRSNSLDSRYFGTVPASYIVGKLGLRVYPFKQSQVF